MEYAPGKLFALSRDGVVAVRDGKISYANAAAREIFRGELTDAPEEKLPAHLIRHGSGEFVSTAEVDGKEYSVICTTMDEDRVFIFSPVEKAASTLATERLRADMSAAIFNMGIAIDLLSGQMESGANERTARHMDILRHNYFALRRMTGNLDTVSAIENGTLYVKKDSVDLVSLCGDLVQTMSALLGEKISFTFLCDLRLLVIKGDQQKLERMLLNLISNSCEAMPEGGSITLKLSCSGSRAVISVTDNGPGIAEDVLKNVFRRFEDADCVALGDTGGGGLGLSVAQGIVRAHGGAMVMESTPGNGTAVHIMLPIPSDGQGDFSGVTEFYGEKSMDVILTELSNVLGSEVYSKRFMD